MRTRLATKAGAAVQARMKLARLLEAPEKALEKRVLEIESGELFARLRDGGVVRVEAPEHARFASRRFAGRGLRASAGELPALIDGRGDLVELIQKVGQEAFEENFLGEASASDAARAKACGITLDEAKRLREYVDRLFVQEQFEAAPAASESEPLLSAVAGVAIEDGKPVLAFFHREIWNKRYRVDDEKRRALLAELKPREAKRADALLRELDFLDRRKTTLYRVLEAVLAAQSAFLSSGDPARREPLTQKSLAERLDITPSVLNRLIANKSVEMPWGTEAAMSVFVPSRKSLLLGQLHDLARENPDATDETLRVMISRIHGVELSRRSIAQYRADAGAKTRKKTSAKS